MRFNSVLRSRYWVGLLSLAWLAAPLLGAPTRRVRARPGFLWPQSEQATYAANRLPKKEILSFLATALNWPAGDMPYLAEFRFARLGPKEICLVAAWGLRDASMEEVICPANGGEYWDTSLPDYAPGSVAWSVVDLKGDGSREVVSSDAVTLPVYWYEIYSFTDGRPHEVSSEFPQFYRAVLVPQLSLAEYVLSPPLGQEPPSSRARYEKLVVLFTQLKYRRRILGDKKAGLEQGIVWTKAPDTDVQALGVATLADIQDPLSIATLRKLGSSTRSPGVCGAVVNALATLEGRAPGGVISDARDIKKFQECNSMKPAAAHLLQNLPVPPAKP